MDNTGSTGTPGAHLTRSAHFIGQTPAGIARGDEQLSFTHVLFPIDVAVLLWGGLYAREGRLRSLIPIRR